MIKVLLKSSAAIRLKSLTSSYHKCFNEKCLIECEVNSLDSVRLYHVTDDKESVDKIDSSKIRVKGVRMRLESYDSHSNMRNIRYQQSSLPTVLLLPNGESDFRAFDYLIGSLVEQNFRVLAFKFPGFGKSKLVKNDPIYDLSIKQRVCIVHDFLHYFLPDRKIPLNSVIGFGENSTLIPFVSQAFGNTYPGHKSTIMVNPAPPNFISNLKETSLETYFGEHDMTKGIYKKQITKKLVKSREQYNPTFKNTDSDHLFNLYLTYKEINEKLVEFACFNLIPYGKNSLIFLNEDQNVYDTRINEYFKNHSEFESNLHRLPVTDDSDNLILSITNKCLDLVKNTL